MLSGTRILLDSKGVRILLFAYMKIFRHLKLNQRFFFFVLLATLPFISAVTLPSTASALEASAQTRQLLPPGGNACAPIAATAFTPYIYEGALHSFDFTVPDASYVALLGSVGENPLPFRLMTRRIDSSGAVRIHVDVETTPIRGTLPLQVTLISARAGQPVCLGIVSINLGSGPVAPIAAPVSTPIVTPPKSVGTVTPPPIYTPDIGATPDTNPWAPSSTPGSSDATDNATAASVVSTVQSKLRDLCASEASAYRLWLILLVLFTLIVGALLWAEFPMSMPWARTPERVATFILVLLLLLLGFWYFSVACRAALWMPLVAFLIALLGLLAAFWNHPRVTQLLLIQDSNL